MGSEYVRLEVGHIDRCRVARYPCYMRSSQVDQASILGGIALVALLFFGVFIIITLVTYSGIVPTALVLAGAAMIGSIAALVSRARRKSLR